jgi:hypothetical protein
VTVQKLQFQPGFNQEVTRYAGEGRWWSGDKVRFRQGFPEKIGGYTRMTTGSFLGTCRSIYPWTTLGGARYIGAGTNEKFYVLVNGQYRDITPLRATATLTDPFTATDGSQVVTVTDSSHGALADDYVVFSGATGLGGNLIADVLNQEFRVIEVIDQDTYTIEVPVPANSTDAAGSPGGGTVTAEYQISPGAAIAQPISGWSAGAWGVGNWGIGATGTVQLRIWTQANFGEDLVYAPRGGVPYYWTAGSLNRGVRVDSLPGASDVPTVVNSLMVSDVSRFVMAFGCNELGDTAQDGMLIRWSDQEDVSNWTPSPLNQAGGLRISSGSEIIARQQFRQEILVWTDTAMYGLQYQGPPIVWGAQILGEGISIIGPNAAVVASGVAYWMGAGKFYRYDGTVQTLECDLKRKVFNSLNLDQTLQVFAGANEQFNEVWWFYPGNGSTVPDHYVIYNYAQNIWYDGTLTRFAWVDRGAGGYPVAATHDRLVEHEVGCCDDTGEITEPIPSYIESTEFDLDDGDRFGFVTRILPDITFAGSTATNPQVTLTLYPMKNAGTGFGTSVGGVNTEVVRRSVSAPVEQFTGQVFVRLRGRQMVLRVSSEDVGVKWQLGGIRYDVRQDGRK